jgi:hypothetical protein
MEVSTNNQPIQIYGIKYIKPNQLGDFNWMCKQPEYSNTLFIFNDNEEYHNSDRKGHGNAVVRCYNKYNSNLKKPKSAGIPTGTLSSGGYQELNSDVINIVTGSIKEIKELLQFHSYDSICYSVSLEKKLGTGIFNVNDKVINYIDEQIKSLSILPVIYIGLEDK